MKTIVNHFLKSHENELVLPASNPKKVWGGFKKSFKVIKAAGGIVKKGDSYLFIFRRGKWDLPKGKIDKGESAKMAALREVQEECGVSGLVITRKLQKTWHIYQSEFPDSIGQWVLKKTTWFEMNYSGNELLVPQIEEEITEAKWIRAEDLYAVMNNTYPSLKEFWRNYL